MHIALKIRSKLKESRQTMDFISDHTENTFHIVLKVYFKSNLLFRSRLSLDIRKNCFITHFLLCFQCSIIEQLNINDLNPVTFWLY